jgi:hypothetical protein
MSSDPVELMNMFKEALVVKYNEVKEYLKRQQRKPILRNAKQNEDYKKATHCWICGKLLDQYRLKVLFHNGMGYDFHHILKYMPSDVKFESPIRIIGITSRTTC